MATFLFEAKSLAGKNVRGEIEATSEAEARVRIRAQKLIPLKIATKATAAPTVAGKKIKGKDLQVFTRQFSTLLESGIPVIDGLDALARSTANINLAMVLRGVVKQVSEGKRLGDALSMYPKSFDEFYINMVKAGEEGGVLDTVLKRLAEYIEKSVKIVSKIRGAMVYPAAIMLVAVIVISVIMIFVIPQFEELFSSLGQELPGITVFVINMSRGLVNNWYYIFGGLGAAIAALIYWKGTPEGKKTIDSILINTPLIKDVIQKGGIARFSRTLATLLGAGVGIMESLEISAKTTGNYILENCFMRSRQAVADGKSMTVPLASEKFIPPMVIQMIAVGEQTGNIDTMLGKVADFYEDEVDAAVGALTASMEPLLMVVLGGIIGTLVIAMYMPIFEMAGAF